MVSHKQKLRSFHLFAGAGGGILADLLLEHEVIGACEIEKYPRDVLLARQQDGILPAFPIWDDVCTLDGNPWRGSVDILCGGFPCQDISAAGKGAGISGERSGLWKEYARLIGEMRPQFVFAENSPLLRTRGLGVVLEDLAALGYNARWGVLGARDVGAPHKRDRMWVLAWRRNDTNTSSERWDNRSNHREERCFLHNKDWNATQDKPEGDKRVGRSSEVSSDVAYANNGGCSPIQHTRGSAEANCRREKDVVEGGSSNLAYTKELRTQGAWWHTDPAELADSLCERGEGHWNELGIAQEVRQGGQNLPSNGDTRDTRNQNHQVGTTEPLVGRVANGVADRVHRLKAIGNGQVPQCAALAFSILSEGLI
jgi:DNA (cytosine-5)-methyltransferase 1